MPRPTGAPGTRDRGRRELGRLAEEITCRHLRQLGWKVLGRNWRVRVGELDIIALDGGTVVFVEVKAGRIGLSGPGPERPALAVGARKQTRLRRLAEAWLARNWSGGYPDLRFDVVGIAFGEGSTPESIEHIRSAF
jgi:putative endonuclease